jgi:hypothetical protein
MQDSNQTQIPQNPESLDGEVSEVLSYTEHEVVHSSNIENKSFSIHKKTLLAGIIPSILVLLLLTGLVSWRIISNSDNGQQANTESTTNSVDLSGFKLSVESFTGADQLIINGDIIANNSIILSPQDEPVNPQVGLLYYDKTTNVVKVYDGTGYKNVAAGADGSEVCFVGQDCGFATTTSVTQVQNQITNLSPGQPLPDVLSRFSLVSGSVLASSTVNIRGNLGVEADANITGDVSARNFRGNFIGDGSQITGINATCNTCVDLQPAIPGTVQSGNIQISGAIVSGELEIKDAEGFDLFTTNSATGTILTGTLLPSRQPEYLNNYTYSLVADTIQDAIDVGRSNGFDYHDSQDWAAIGPDGFMRIVYFSNNYRDVIYLRCLNIECDLNTKRVVASVADTEYADAPLLRLGSDGLPRIAYMNDYREWRYIKCNDIDCATRSDNLMAVSARITGGFYEASFDIDSNDIASLLYMDYDNPNPTTLNYARCNDDLCSTFTTQQIAINQNVYVLTLSVGTDNFARITYSTNNSNNVYIRCLNSSCSSSTSSVIANTDQAGKYYVDSAVDNNGNIYVAYTSSQGAYLIKCNDADCASSTVQVISAPSAGTTWNGSGIDIEIGPSGLPRIGYIIGPSQGYTLVYTKCLNISCSDNAFYTFPNDFRINYFTSMGVDSQDNPYIIFSNSSSDELMLATINDQTYLETVITLFEGSTIGTQLTPYNNVFSNLVTANSLVLGESAVLSSSDNGFNLQDADGRSILESDTKTNTLSVGSDRKHFLSANRIRPNPQNQEIRGYIFSDVNNDGFDDSVYSSSSQLLISYNDGSGEFIQPKTYAAGTSADNILVSDMNGDGLEDMILIGYTAVAVCIKDTEYNFSCSNYGTSMIGLNYSAYSVSLGDVDNDGDTDILIPGSFYNGNPYPDYYDSYFVFLENDGSGTITESISYVTTGYTAINLQLIDINNDGTLDAYSDNYISSNSGLMRVYYGAGDGTFGPQQNDLDIPLTYYKSFVVDWNADGLSDIVMSSVNSEISIYVNDGMGGFVETETYTLPIPHYITSYGRSIKLVDFNNDGYLDFHIISYANSSYHIHLLYGIGEGEFEDDFTYGGRLDGYYNSDGGYVAVAIVNDDKYVDAVFKDSSASLRYIENATYNRLQISGVDSNGFENTTLSVNVDGSTKIRSNSNNPALQIVSTEGQSIFTVNSGGSVTIGNGLNNGNFRANNSFNYSNGNSVEIADFDLDGIKDVISYGSYPSTIGVFYPKNGTFQQYSLPLISGFSYYNFHQAKFIDINNDGLTDIVGFTYGFNIGDPPVYYPGALYSVLNNGDNTFTATTTIDTASVIPGDSRYHDIQTSDVNGDGWVDIIVVENGANTFRVFMNNGDGTFAAGIDYSMASTNYLYIQLGDVNNDGFPDVVSTRSNRIGVYINNGDGTFVAGVEYTASNYGYDVRLVDIDKDGYLDIITTYDTGISYFSNNGDGTFATRVNSNFSGLYVANYFDIGDFDGDGNEDVLTYSSARYVEIYVGSGSGTFSYAGKSELDGLSSNSYIESKIYDLNKDGRSDLLINTGNQLVSLLNNWQSATQTIVTSHQSGLQVVSSDRTLVYLDVEASGVTKIANGVGKLNVGTNDTTAKLNVGDSKPASTAGVSGTAAGQVLSVIGGIGGDTTRTSSATGGVGGTISIQSGTGGQATAALTSSVGGAGGLMTIAGGSGGGASIAGTGNNAGGTGAIVNLNGGSGGIASGVTTGTNTGGAGGALNINGGAGGNATSGLGNMVGGAGGILTLSGGAGGLGTTSGGNGGAVVLQGGLPSAMAGAAGGAATVAGRAGSSTGTGGNGGALTLQGGAAGGDNTVNRTGGNVAISAGASRGASAGGAVTVAAGLGGNNLTVAANATGGAGGGITVTLGGGGQALGATTTGTGGAGGTYTITGGAGASGILTGTANNTGGAGSAFSWTAGVGGAATGATSGNNTGGNGGAITLQAGTGGVANTGTGNLVGGTGGALTLSAGTGGIGLTSGGNGGAVILQGGAAANMPGAAGGAVTVRGTAGTSNTTGGNGGALTLQGGAAGGDNTVNRTGGNVAISAGASRGASAGGAVTVAAGLGGNNLTVAANATGGAGGGITVTLGGGGQALGATTTGTGGAGGTYTITGGAGASGILTGTANNTGGAGSAFSWTAGVGGAATGATSGNNTGGNGGAITLQAGTGGVANTGTGNLVGGNGGALTLNAGTGGLGVTGGGSGGTLTLQAGLASATEGASGGVIVVTARPGSATGTGGAGGAMTFTAGAAGGDNTVNRAGGAISLTAGLSRGPTQAGGAVTITAGAAGTNTTVAASATGPSGGGVTLTTGAGGNASGATTTSTGGTAGTLAITGGTGGIANVAGTVNNVGGLGAAINVIAGTGGAANGATSGINTGGIGGVLTVRGGTGGASTVASGGLIGGTGGLLDLQGGTGGAGTTTAGNGGDIRINGGIASSATGSGGTIIFRTALANTLAERARITPAGEFGLGQSASISARLHLNTVAAANIGQIIQGVASQTGDLLQARSSTGTVLASISATGGLTVTSVTINGNLTVNGKVLTANTSGSTTAAVGANAGVGATTSVVGNDTSGTVTITTGTGSTAGILGTVTFSSAYTATPRIVMTPANANGSTLQYFYNATTGNFTIRTNNAPVDATQYQFTYWAVQ